MQGGKTRKAVKMPSITVGEKTRRTVRMRPITLLFSFVCLIGLSVSATYLIDHAKYEKQDKKALSVPLQNSLQKLETEYRNLDAQHKDLASRLDTAEQKNTRTASELASALKELEAARADALKLRGELDAKLSEIEALNADRQTLEQKYNGFKEMLATYLVLEPTLVGSGETATAFDGKLQIFLHEVSDKDKCPKGSAAFSDLISGKDQTKLCLRTGKPESFKYQGKKYLFNLLESKESKGAHHYLISILK
jgi:uncharacterized protein YlxW (UPF0749 family)